MWSSRIPSYDQVGNSFDYWYEVWAADFETAHDKEAAIATKSTQYGLGETLSLQMVQHQTDINGKSNKRIGIDPAKPGACLPEAVNLPREPGQNRGIRYNQLIFVLIKAIQEQQEQNETLKSQVAAPQK